MGLDMSVEGMEGPITFAPVTSGSSKKRVASFTVFLCLMVCSSKDYPRLEKCLGTFLLKKFKP